MGRRSRAARARSARRLRHLRRRFHPLIRLQTNLLVASSQPAESASTNNQGVVDIDVVEMVASDVEDRQRAPLALRTRQVYASHVEGSGASTRFP